MIIETLAEQGKKTPHSSLAEAVGNRIYDLRKQVIKQSMLNFNMQEHRLEFVAKIRGVEFIDDSMACNLNSAWYALEKMNKPVIWITGGQSRGTDFTQLRSLVKAKVKSIICLGLENETIRESFSDIVPSIIDATSATIAVETAYFSAEEGDIILLSPGCPSFDLFESYEDRGAQFKNAVNEL